MTSHFCDDKNSGISINADSDAANDQGFVDRDVFGEND